MTLILSPEILKTLDDESGHRDPEEMPRPPLDEMPGNESAEDTEAEFVEAEEIDSDQEAWNETGRIFVEGMEQGGGFTEDDAGLIVDAVKGLKLFARLYLRKASEDDLARKFENADDYLMIIREAEFNADMSLRSLKEIRIQFQADMPGFENVELKKLVQFRQEYIRVQNYYNSGELPEYIENGLQKWGALTIRKYFADQAPDPLLMLAIYVVFALALDAWKIIQYHRSRKNG